MKIWDGTELKTKAKQTESENQNDTNNGTYCLAANPLLFWRPNTIYYKDPVAYLCKIDRVPLNVKNQEQNKKA
jgi:hypothetical protein